MTASRSTAADSFFLPTSRGRLFALASIPQNSIGRGLLYVHPFAEEMNKSRRMAAVAARRFAARGYLVLQVDLTGCGDSDGDFGAATWDIWLDDVALAWAWLRSRCSQVGVWTLRAGSLLAADWMARTPDRPPLLLWQPVLDGEQHFNQFLRLKAASEMLGATDAKNTIAELRAAVASRSIEVAGYTLSPGLAAGMRAARARLPHGYRSRIEIFEVAAGTRLEPAPRIAALAAQWTQAGAPTRNQVVSGPGFWQTQEIETAPALVDASVAALDSLSA